LIDEFRVYNGVLSDAAVLDSYARGPDALMGGRPALRVNTSGNVLQLSWPPDAFDYTLEQATNLQPGVVWNAVSNTALLQNGQQTLSLPITNRNQFFRLRK